MNKKVNFITILTDQYRYDALSCLGINVVKTPNLDRLARGGVLFTNATTPYPVCGPARASLLTGMHPVSHGFYRNSEIWEEGLSENVVTIDELLKQNGYDVRYFGKWHTGETHRECYTGGLDYYLDEYKQYLDEKYPFDGNMEGKKIDRYTQREYYYEDIDDKMEHGPDKYTADDDMLGKFSIMPHHNEAGKSIADKEDSLTAFTAKQLMSFIDDYDGNKPFAATCSILHPHAPFIASEPYYSMYSPEDMPMPFNIEDDLEYDHMNTIPSVLKPNSEDLGRYISLYYGLITEVDHWVGEILDCIERNNLIENTVIMFVADHGEIMGSHFTVSKMKPFEESMRVPMIISMPKAITSNKKTDVNASLIDIFPTIADFADIDIPENVEGKSLKQELLGSGFNPREYSFCDAKGWNTIGMLCVRSPQYKLILNPNRQMGILNKAILYDLTNDPGEQKNLLSKKNINEAYCKKAEELKGFLVSKMKELNYPSDIIKVFSSMDFKKKD